ncbi:MAG: DUF4160 domain-containing protein [Thermoleophilia bacterium]
MMAAFRRQVGAVSIEIYDVDHGPPHCHVSGLSGGSTARVNLLTLEVTKPPGEVLPRAVRRHLREWQVEMLEAWEQVISIDRSK